MTVNIIGAGLAGLSAAITLAEHKISVRLISLQVSERAQSVMAEGGINAAMNVSGENDTVRDHEADTLRGGCDLADPQAVRELTEGAPGIVQMLMNRGVPFNMEGDLLVQRYFGGQKKRRTAYSRSSTGKALMSAMIDEARKYEGTWIRRFPHHRFLSLTLSESGGTGVRILDEYTGEVLELAGPVILAYGGPCGLLRGRTTGTTANDASALAQVFSQGMELANLEFIQYHPTTVGISGKRLLISEAARGEGGRLFVRRDGKPWYFMEDKYPELGNLMPRDVVSREMNAVVNREDCEDSVYLDLTGLPAAAWKTRLPDLRRELIHYLGIDPKKKPIPVQPGIHFFMGGIRVDRGHRTNIPHIYAAGECACQYHGANRLGGNSLLGALYGGAKAAATLMEDGFCEEESAPLTEDGLCGEESVPQTENGFSGEESVPTEAAGMKERESGVASDPDEIRNALFSEALSEELAKILDLGMGITRDEEQIRSALSRLTELKKRAVTEADEKRFDLAEAMLRSAEARRESRGAHTRTDFPDRDDKNFRKTTVVCRKGGYSEIRFEAIPDETAGRGGMRSDTD